MGYCTEDQARRLIEHFDKQKQWRKDQMPDEREAINVWCEAYTRLKELGWQEIIYCPKDGTEFLVLEPGSSGIHRCVYQGEWPKGSWWVLTDDGDMCPSHPALWKPSSQAVEVKP